MPHTYQVSVEVMTTIARARKRVFDLFVPIKLPDIFTGWGPLPAVTNTTEQTGSWDRVGSQRFVHLSDGSTAIEQVTACQKGHYFAYTVTDFTNVVDWLASGAKGEWWFTDTATNQTSVRWQYTFVARSRWSFFLLVPIVLMLWRPYMAKALNLFRHVAES